MAQGRSTGRRSTGARKGSARSRAASAGQTALNRLSDSIDAAQAALKDLRGEMSRGSRELLKDLDTTLKHARKNLRGANRKIVKDLEDVQTALTARGERGGAGGTAGGRGSARKAGGASGSTARASSRSTGGRPSASRGAAKK